MSSIYPDPNDPVQKLAVTVNGLIGILSQNFPQIQELRNLLNGIQNTYNEAIEDERYRLLNGEDELIKTLRLLEPYVEFRPQYPGLQAIVRAVRPTKVKVENGEAVLDEFVQLIRRTLFTKYHGGWTMPPLPIECVAEVRYKQEALNHGITGFYSTPTERYAFFLLAHENVRVVIGRMGEREAYVMVTDGNRLYSAPWVIVYDHEPYVDWQAMIDAATAWFDEHGLRHTPYTLTEISRRVMRILSGQEMSDEEVDEKVRSPRELLDRLPVSAGHYYIHPTDPASGVDLTITDCKIEFIDVNDPRNSLGLNYVNSTSCWIRIGSSDWSLQEPDQPLVPPIPMVENALAALQDFIDSADLVADPIMNETDTDNKEQDDE